MEIAQKIKELAESHLADASHFIVDAVVSKHKPHKVSVFVDGDQGVTIDHCSDLSRALSEDLDKLDLIKDNYTLEVGTPGVDHPLKLKRQYVKNINRSLKVQRIDKSSVTGKLTQVSETGLVLNAETKVKGKKTLEINSIEIPFSEIEKAIVMVSFK
ncbi:MAG: ribosome maturation factor RimP [Cyclobacteriaceae bacterium]|nr:ribosome maturation factor RimP [Cyclobacteriaceae bacterium]